MSLSSFEVSGIAQVTPQLIAYAFWEMNCEEQADFFSHLDRISKGSLCLQMAAVVQTLIDRADKGDHAGHVAFQTMLAHAQSFAESATDYRVWAAKRRIAIMADAGRATIGELA